jgi:hypothetical protein
MRVIPPLSQSLVELGSCPESYLYWREGNRQADSIQSERGSEVHHVMSEYVRWCVAHKVAVDFPAFDRLSAAAGPVAGPILDNMRDTFVVKWQNVLATEVRLRLDSDLNPTKHEEVLVGTKAHPFLGEPAVLEAMDGGDFPGLEYTGQPAAHAGTLDVIEINDDATEAVIPDYKSHPRPFEPDTYQGMLYPFMLMKHIPTVRKVTFELVFVRYGGDVRRSVIWTRDDMPEMAIHIRRARERQLALEAAGEGPALPGSHCQYCPKITRPTLCSIAEFNPQINDTMEERMRFLIWSAEQAKVSRAAMKDHVDATGKPITITDANGKTYAFGIEPVESKVFPLDRTSIKLLEDHFKVSPKDDWESMKLRISSTSLKPKLKAKMRAGLSEAFDNSVIEMEVKPKFAIRKPDGETDTGYSSEDDF